MNAGRRKGSRRFVLAALTVVALVSTGCSRPVPSDALIVAQSPRAAAPTQARSELDLRYPTGSRIVLATTEPQPRVLRVLSAGLAAAGEPVLSWDGQRVVFAGKLSRHAEWQIYEAPTQGGRCRALTTVPGGAQDPALLPDGSLLFVSPVTAPGMTSPPAAVPALFVQPAGGKPRQLTYSSAAVADPTVLLDGRILLVMTPARDGKAPPRSGLYTINNDGTEITAFAGQHDAPSLIHRPRQLEDGRVAFIVGDGIKGETSAESVLSARPFRSRTTLFANLKMRFCAVQPAPNGDLLVCANVQGGSNPCGLLAVFRLAAQATNLGRPVLEDPDWNSTAALPTNGSRRPMGRLSNVDPSHRTGQLLCLDVNDSSYVPPGRSGLSRATRVRLFTTTSATTQCILGDVDVQADGSFMAEVPADVPLGFETLNEQGEVLRREPALVWVRPGENRSCIGCHEPHNHSPRNLRPLAVRVPVPKLAGQPVKLVQNRN